MKKHSARKPVCSAGFTLIELLVVIAIIAVLAAILFPVFARAKAAAKASASLSNVKQIALATLLYSGDYDDCFPLSGQWHSTDPDAHPYFAASHYMPWTGLTESYMKNRDIFVSPFRTGTQPFSEAGLNGCTTDRQCRLMYPTYGYNAMYLNPCDRNNGKQGSLSTTAVAKPAEQVMHTEIWHRGTTRYRGFVAGPDFCYASIATSEAPDAVWVYPSRTTPYGSTGWGAYHKNFEAGLGLTEEEGWMTAGVAFRSPGTRSPVAFTDGHVKAMKDSQLAIGTDWIRDQTDIAQNLVNGKYLWDPRGD